MAFSVLARAKIGGGFAYPSRSRSAHTAIKHMQSVGGAMKGKNKRKNNMYFTYFSDEEEEDACVYGRSPVSVGASSSFAASSFQDSSLSKRDFHKDAVLKPRNEKQKEYLDALNEDRPTIVIATGAAGTGKTMIACTAAIKKLVDGDIQKLVITRPMVNVDDEEGIGFLPGSLEEKCAPWLAPLTDVFYKYITPQKFQALIARQTIEICPLDMMRGRSFENAFIIVDEAQNCSTTQMLMLLTRIGNGSKLIITGDPMQHDRARINGSLNGLSDFLLRIADSQQHHPERVSDIKAIHFTEECIVRHPIIKNILKMYDVSYPPSA